MWWHFDGGRISRFGKISRKYGVSNGCPVHCAWFSHGGSQIAAQGYSTKCSILVDNWCIEIIYIYVYIQWNLSITAHRIKDTYVIQTAIDGHKQSAIETCTYLTSELRTPLYSVLQTHSPAPTWSYCIVNKLCNTVNATPGVQSLALANQFHMDHHEDSRFTTSKYQILRFLPLSGLFWAFFLLSGYT